MRCSRCGSEVPAEAGYCRGCGAILRGSSATAALLDASPFLADEAVAPPGATPSARNDPARRSGTSPLDWAAAAGAAVVLASLGINWYQATVVVGGTPETITRHLLSGDAGIQRWMVPVCAVLIVAEVVANRAWTGRSRRQWRSYRGLLLLLCVVEVVLVASCMLSSPLSPDLLANIGISINIGPGSWVALGGALGGVGAAFARMLSGGPQLGRSMSAASAAGDRRSPR